MPAEKTKSPAERTKICLQKFADGVMLGYRLRILEAIDKEMKERKEEVLKLFGTIVEPTRSILRGLKIAKTIIENLK